ncbi:MAG TPA: chemotaxis protein CheB, partial [Burkholderiaceae bacterium]
MNDARNSLIAPFDVVGIIASAGGLEAISAVLADLQPGFGAAIVVGQHLGGESGLVDILARRIALPVVWAGDGMILEAGRVHVTPPRLLLEVHPDFSCALSPSLGLARDRPLTVLLQSLADSVGDRALAVVLTGMGSDGAGGARAVKMAGGAVIAQSEETSDHPDMPRAAVIAGAVDLVLPLREIGSTISRVMSGGRFPQPRNEREARHALFGGSGPAREALREVEWESTEFGQVLGWPASLKAVVAAMLASGFATCIGWGPAFNQLYNDAWIGVLGNKHPAAAAAPSHGTWQELWPSLAGTYRRVLETSQTSYVEDMPLSLKRHGYTEEAYFNLSCSALSDDAGVVCGVMTIAAETTERVLAERRLVALRALTSAVSGAETVTEVCRRAEQLLAEQPRDLPFLLLYRIDGMLQRATLAASAGLAAGSPFAPYAIELQMTPATWPLGRVVRQGEPLLVDDLADRMPALHAGNWPEPPTRAMLLPVRVENEAAGAVLVAGLSPRIAFDRTYEDFVGQLAQQLGASLTDARLRESARERLNRLSELDRTKTEFFSNVSHEFRTPLTLILAPLEDVQTRAAASVELQGELQVAARNAKRLLNLVDTLLDFSQIEAGRLRAQWEMLD